MVDMANKGMRAPAIAAALSRSRSAVLRVLKAAGFSWPYGPTAQSERERFIAFLPDDRIADGCWLWQGHIGSAGYGGFPASLAGGDFRYEGAHRAAYRIFKGPIPLGLLVRHACDNRACVNPAHLDLGTQKDNMADCVRRRRIASGDRQGGAKLTWPKVREIRRRYAAGESQVALAKAFGVKQPNVSRIVRGETWWSRKW